MVKITVNTDTANNTIPTTILLDKATTNNSLDCKSTKEPVYGVLYHDVKIIYKHAEK